MLPMLAIQGRWTTPRHQTILVVCTNQNCCTLYKARAPWRATKGARGRAHRTLQTGPPGLPAATMLAARNATTHPGTLANGPRCMRASVLAT